MCCSNDAPDPPDYTPVANASVEAAQFGYRATQDQLAYAREKDAFAQQQYAEQKPVFDKIVNSQLAAQDQQMAAAGQYYDYLENTYLPLTTEMTEAQLATQRQQHQQSEEYWQRQQKFFGLEDQLIKDAQNFNTPAYRETLAQQAKADTERAFAGQDAANERQLLGMGAGSGPNSGSMLGMKTRTGNAQAAQSGAAMNATRHQADALGRQLNFDTAGLGQGLSQAGGTSAQIGLQAGQGAAGLAGSVGNSYMANPYAGAVSAGSQAGANSMAPGQNYMGNAVALGGMQNSAYGLGMQGAQTQLTGLNSIMGMQGEMYNNYEDPGMAMLGMGLQGLSAGAGLMFSDRRLKTGVVEVGSYPNGLPMYEFQYINDPEAWYRGVMADDVAAVCPEAVVVNEDGYAAVRYDLLGIQMERVA